MSSALKLKKEAEDLYFNQQLERAEAAYLELIKDPYYERQVATQNSFRERVFRCRVRMSKFKEAGDICMEMSQEIIRYESDLLKYSIPKYLRHAYICYHLGGCASQCAEVLQHEKLSDKDRDRLLLEEISVKLLQ